MAVLERHITNASVSRWINRESQQSLLQSVGRYTRFVLFSKMFLGGLSVLMMLTLIILPVLNADEEGLRIAFSTVKEKVDSLPLMTNPTFQGVDDNNQPYMITADSALQHDASTIVLNNIQADIFTENNSWLSVSAQKGTLNTEAKHLLLQGDVQLFQDQGYEFKTQEVSVDMNQHIAKGEQKIDGSGPTGIIAANGFEWDNNKRIMRFVNGVNLRILTDG